MTNKSVFRVASLFFVLALISTTCGWIPFVAPVTIHSTPEGAEVYKVESETPAGITPFKTYIFHGDKAFEVRLDKFHTEPITLNFESPEDVFVPLRPVPVLVYTKPNADIYAAGSDTPLGSTPLDVNVLLDDKNYVLKTKDYYDQEIVIGLSSPNPLVTEMKHRPIITVTTAQTGVKIYENGNFFANAPITQEIMESRTFEFRKEGYYKKTINLTPEKTHKLAYQTTIELTPLPIIEIQSTPAGADVYMVGQSTSIGKAPLKLTIEKETSFEVKADRYYTESFTVSAKSQLAKVTLNAMPYVTITSDPSGAQVYLGDKRLGTTPLEQLIEKETTYKLVQEGYLPQTITLNGKNAQPSITLEEIPPPPPPEPVVEEVVVVEEEVVAAETGSPLSMGLIGGLALAAIAVVGIIIAIAKKKKK